MFIECASKSQFCHLQIEVLRPNGQHAEGELQHYNLHYNVALVSVKDFCPSHPAKIQHLWDDGWDAGPALGLGHECDGLGPSPRRGPIFLHTYTM